jgi:hypothetical protein
MSPPISIVAIWEGKETRFALRDWNTTQTLFDSIVGRPAEVLYEKHFEPLNVRTFGPFDVWRNHTAGGPFDKIDTDRNGGWAVVFFFFSRNRYAQLVLRFPRDKTGGLKNSSRFDSRDHVVLEKGNASVYVYVVSDNR